MSARSGFGLATGRTRREEGVPPPEVAGEGEDDGVERGESNASWLEDGHLFFALFDGGLFASVLRDVLSAAPMLYGIRSCSRHQSKNIEYRKDLTIFRIKGQQE